jgi:Ras-related protein Rab-7A
MYKKVKITISGISGVGKSTLVTVLNGNKPIDIGPTIGAAFFRHVTDDKKTIMEIWDTSGQERYHSLGKMYFRNANYCILVFDISDKDSFDKVDTWKKICDSANSDRQEHITYFLVGNKIDKDNRLVTKSQINNYCHQNNIKHYFEVSSIHNIGVDDLYKILVQTIIDNDHDTDIKKDIVKIDNKIFTDNSPNCYC